MKLFSASALCVLAICSAAGPALADNGAGSGLSDGPWNVFIFGGVGERTGPYSITTGGGENRFDITDGWLSGDRFHVDFPGLGLSFDTSVPGSVGDQVLDDYDTAFSDSRWSHASADLPDGTHDFFVTVLDSPFGSGAAAYRSFIPAPGGAALIGLAGFAAARRRRM